MLEKVILKDKTLQVPILQGGMGVGISLSSLAGNVMKQDGMGIISAAHPGYAKDNFWQNSKECNHKAILEEVRKAREISEGKGLLGINIMCASKDYDFYVKCAQEAKVDAIICGAGLPLHLPALVEDNSILLAPVVSSGKAIRLLCSMWERRYQRVPDFVIVEGSLAGGHLGFKKEDLLHNTCLSLEEILQDVLKEVAIYEKKFNTSIPVFVAGGIYDGKDIAKFIKLGASGVQMATRFICTYECDAHPSFKEAILKAKKEDIEIVQSPAGFPGRALSNTFIQEVKKRGMISMKNCLHCLQPCTPENTPYCISQALINAVQGNMEKALVFVGENAYRCTTMMSVEALFKELIEEANAHLALGGRK